MIIITVSVFALLSAAGIAATIAAMRVDGYRAVPAREA
jgi:hypothetical protein